MLGLRDGQLRFFGLICVATGLLMIWLFTTFVRGSDGLPLFAITLPLATAVQVALIATVCGVLAAIAQERPIPVYFVGVGEKLEDLETFNAREFAQALLT